MNLANLRVEGADQALHTACHALNLVPDFTWKQGEPRRRGGVFLSSGWSVTVADAKNPRVMVEAIRAFLAQCTAQGFEFRAHDLAAELSVGITVGDSEQFVAFVDFTTADLLALGTLGIELSVAAYPTSDEANEADQSATPNS
jgi:hypothetical protein